MYVVRCGVVGLHAPAVNPNTPMPFLTPQLRVRAQDSRTTRIIGNLRTSRQRIQSIIETAERGQYDRYDDQRPGMDRRSAPPPPRTQNSWDDDTRSSWSNEFYTASEAIRQERERYGSQYGGRMDEQRYDDRRPSYDDRRPSYDDRRPSDSGNKYVLGGGRG